MGVCNHCTLRSMKRFGKVITKPDPKPGFPDGVKVLIDYGKGEEPAWAAWFAALTERCAC